jgi:hypothetical protein
MAVDGSPGPHDPDVETVSDDPAQTFQNDH